MLDTDGEGAAANGGTESAADCGHAGDDAVECAQSAQAACAVSYEDGGCGIGEYAGESLDNQDSEKGSLLRERGRE